MTPDDDLICPNPQTAVEAAVMRLVHLKPDGTRVYEGRACETCCLRSQCATKADDPRTVTLNPEVHRQRLAALEAARSAEHRAAMKQRFTHAESRYGHGKRQHRWGKAPYRSQAMNRIFNLLVVIALNVEKTGALRAARTTNASARRLSRGL